MKQKVSLLVLGAFAYTILLQGALPALAAPESKRQYSLAVLDLDVSGTITPDDANLMSRQLREELRALGIFEVMGRPTMVSRLQSAGVPEPACPTTDCALRAGSDLGVQLVVAGTVRRVGQTYYIDAFMVHVGSGEEVQTASEEYTGTVDGAIGYMAVVAKKLVGVQAAGQQPSVTPRQQPPSTPSPYYQPEDGGGSSKWLRYAAIGVLGAGGIAAVLIATGSDDNKGTNTSKLPDPPPFPSKP